MDFNQYCNEELSRSKTVTISKEKGRRLIHFIKTKEILPPLPDASAPGPINDKQFVKYFRRHNFELVNDPVLGIVDELRVREGDLVSVTVSSNNYCVWKALVSHLFGTTDQG